MIISGKKQHYTLDIFTKNNPIVLERLLQVTRYRGFDILGMEMKSNKQKKYNITIKIKGDRSLENLINQIAKLYEVEDIKQEEFNNLKVTGTSL